MPALDPADLLRVEGQLEHGGRLRRPRELGVPDLVAPWAEARRRLVHADQEVGPPPPAVAGEGGLVDDVGAGAHRVLGGRGGGCRTRRPSTRDVDDVAAILAQLREERLLVLVALPGDEVGELVPAVRPAALAARRLELEPRQIRAGEVGREVGRREPEVAVAELHGSEYRPIGRSAVRTLARLCCATRSSAPRPELRDFPSSGTREPRRPCPAPAMSSTSSSTRWPSPTAGGPAEGSRRRACCNPCDLRPSSAWNRADREIRTRRRRPGSGLRHHERVLAPALGATPTRSAPPACPCARGSIAGGEFTVVGGRRAMAAILRRHPDLDAVFASSDLMGIGALQSLDDAGKRVPDDSGGGWVRRPWRRRPHPPAAHRPSASRWAT